MRNSNIILSKGIKLDKTYNNCLTLSSDDLLEVLRSDSHYITSASDFSFIRSTGRISTPFTYSQSLSSNYMAFQNPDYDNKWFFAWVDNVVYKSDRCTEIEYTIDYFSTWWDNWARTETYVLREHITDDYIGASRIPESFGVDSYIARDTYKIQVNPDKIAFLFTEARKSTSTIENPQYDSPYTAYQGIGGVPFNDGLPMTLWRITADLTQSGISTLMQYYGDYVNEGKGGDLVGIFTYSSDNEIKEWVNIEKIVSIDGYTPANKKCLQYPFVKVTVSNQQGQTLELRQEDFGEVIKFKYGGTDNYKGQSICFPSTYKGITDATDFGLLIDNYPTIPMTVDSFATYLAQNATNIALGAIGGAVGTVYSIATGNPLAAIAGIGNAINQLGQIQSARTVPDSVVGMSGGNLINTKLNNFAFLIEINTAYTDVIKSVDAFFTKYGYAVNQIKEPNFYGRTNNYVQIAPDSVIGFGDVPAADMNIINEVFRKGVTLYHSHDSIGTY